MNSALSFGWMTKDGETDFSLKVDTGIQGTKGNSSFTTVQTQVTAAETAYNAYVVALNNAVQGGVENTAIRNARRAELIALLRPLLNNMNAIANGDAEMLLSSGFPLIKTNRTPIGPLPTPAAPTVNQGPNSGTMKVSTPAIYGAVMYVARIALASAPTVFLQTLQGTSSRFLFDGLTPGELYNVQVMAYGAAGPTDWSDDATLRVI